MEHVLGMQSLEAPGLASHVRMHTCIHMQVFTHTKETAQSGQEQRAPYLPSLWVCIPGTLLKAQLSQSPCVLSGGKELPWLAGAGAWQESSVVAWKLKEKHTSWFQAEVLVCDFFFLLLSPSFFSLLFEECLCCYLWQARNTRM